MRHACRRGSRGERARARERERKREREENSDQALSHAGVYIRFSRVPFPRSHADSINAGKCTRNNKLQDRSPPRYHAPYLSLRQTSLPPFLPPLSLSLSLSLSLVLNNSEIITFYCTHILLPPRAVWPRIACDTTGVPTAMYYNHRLLIMS